MKMNTAMTALLPQFLVYALAQLRYTQRAVAHFKDGSTKKAWRVFLNADQYHEFWSHHSSEDSGIRNAYNFGLRSSLPNCRDLFQPYFINDEWLFEIVCFHPDLPDLHRPFEPEKFKNVGQCKIGGFESVSYVPDWYFSGLDEKQSSALFDRLARNWHIFSDHCPARLGCYDVEMISKRPSNTLPTPPEHRRDTVLFFSTRDGRWYHPDNYW